MKTMKIITFFLFLSAFASSSIAQSITVRGGLNFSNPSVMINGNDIEQVETLTGFHAGILGELGSEMLALEVGLLYSQKGYTSDRAIPVFQDQQRNVTMNYLEIPINGKVKFGPENARLYVAAGPYVGFALNGTIEEDGPLGNSDNDINFGNEEADDFKPLDYGLNFGIGVEVSRFQLGATYGLGLANIDTSNDDDDSYKNNVIQVHLGYRIVQ